MGAKYKTMPRTESNRYGDHSPQDFKSCASASSATPRNELAKRKTGSNPRPPPWQGGALPLSYFRKMVPAKGLEPSTL